MRLRRWYRRRGRVKNGARPAPASRGSKSTANPNVARQSRARRRCRRAARPERRGATSTSASTRQAPATRPVARKRVPVRDQGSPPRCSAAAASSTRSVPSGRSASSPTQRRGRRSARSPRRGRAKSSSTSAGGHSAERAPGRCRRRRCRCPPPRPPNRCAQLTPNAEGAPAQAVPELKLAVSGQSSRCRWRRFPAEPRPRRRRPTAAPPETAPPRAPASPPARRQTLATSAAAAARQQRKLVPGSTRPRSHRRPRRGHRPGCRRRGWGGRWRPAGPRPTARSRLPPVKRDANRRGTDADASSRRRQHQQPAGRAEQWRRRHAPRIDHACAGGGARVCG